MYCTCYKTQLLSLELCSNTKQILVASSLSPSDRKFIWDQVRDLFLDSDMWPAGRSLFYLGILPLLNHYSSHQQSMTCAFTYEWHTYVIQPQFPWLVIYGELHVARITTDHIPPSAHNNKPLSSSTILTLPTHLSHTLPLCPSYPSFSVNFC